MSHITLITTPQKDYELIDAGNGQKYERFGKYTLVRPDPQAVWLPQLSSQEWSRAQGTFSRDEERTQWHLGKDVPSEWKIVLDDLSFIIKPSAFKHTGLFPEHMSQWKWMRQIIRERKNQNKSTSVLNLFAYTGGASLACAKEGAEVCHVDGSRAAVSWAKKNALESGLSEAPIRWIVDDAVAFVKREIRRGQKYDAVVMDPPAFGRGAKGEVWKIEEQLIPLLEAVQQLISDDAAFVILNGYAAGYSSISYKQVLQSFWKGDIESGELAISETSGRILPAGIFARINFMAKGSNTGILYKS